uniref:Transmembrane protein n=1 Tax=Panagrolaimus sp. JU765 TaxID=591449 RepID=A0AC34RRF1_9BILA
MYIKVDNHQQQLQQPQYLIQENLLHQVQRQEKKKIMIEKKKHCQKIICSKLLLIFIFCFYDQASLRCLKCKFAPISLITTGFPIGLRRTFVSVFSFEFLS